MSADAPADDDHLYARDKSWRDDCSNQTMHWGMPRTLLATLALALASGACHAGAAHATPPTAIATPIRSPAELDRYLKATPPNESPLSLLPAGARRRFLRTLTWGDRGLGGFDTSDLQQYLTDAQIARVLALFDSQPYAAGLHGRATALTPAQRAAPETPLESRFDRVYFARADGTHGGHAGESESELYDRLLASYQNRNELARLDADDVILLFRAADGVAIAHAPRYLDDLQLDLAELHQRGAATSSRVSAAHAQLVAARRFAEANALAREYPAARIATLPPLTQLPNAGVNPTVLVTQPDGAAMLREPVDMDVPLRIVVVAGCHFSVDAVRAIRANPRLDALFRDHAVWLAGENESLPDVLQWNREYRDQPMYVAWRHKEWSMLASWNIPTFYVFRYGKLTGQWPGWNGPDDLRAHLRAHGLLR